MVIGSRPAWAIFWEPTSKKKKKTRRKGNQILISFTHRCHGVCPRLHILLSQLLPILVMLSFEAVCIGDFAVSQGGHTPDFSWPQLRIFLTTWEGFPCLFNKTQSFSNDSETVCSCWNISAGSSTLIPRTQPGLPWECASPAANHWSQKQKCKVAPWHLSHPLGSAWQWGTTEYGTNIRNLWNIDRGKGDCFGVC